VLNYVPIEWVITKIDGTLKPKGIDRQNIHRKLENLRKERVYIFKYEPKID